MPQAVPEKTNIKKVLNKAPNYKFIRNDLRQKRKSVVITALFRFRRINKIFVSRCNTVDRRASRSGEPFDNGGCRPACGGIVRSCDSRTSCRCAAARAVPNSDHFCRRARVFAAGLNSRWELRQINYSFRPMNTRRSMLVKRQPTLPPLKPMP